MYDIGMIIGGIIPIYLFSLFFGWLLFKKLDQTKKIVLSVSIAFIVSVILSGFGNANGGPFNPMIEEYLVCSLIVLLFRVGWSVFRKPNDD